MSLPKVLIFGQPFNDHTGGGITLSNLFRGWDPDKLAVACSGYYLRQNINRDICKSYYQLGKNEQKWLFPFSLLKKKYYSGSLKNNLEEVRIQNRPKSKLRLDFVLKYFLPFIQYSGLRHIISKTEFSPGFSKWLSEFKPDLIYAQATSRQAVLFCLALQDHLDKPFVYHVMDDWPSSLSSNGLFKSFWKKRIHRELSLLLNKASLLMSISGQMSDEYQRRYGKNFIPFHNAIDLDFWKEHQKRNYHLSSNPSILYAGRTGIGLDQSLEIFSRAISLVNRKLQTKLRLVLQTEEKPPWIEKYTCVEHRYFVPYQELPRQFAKADFLLMPYDFSNTSLNYLQYSMPTKVPEYMISGTPIIIFAPESTAVAQYAKKFGWAKLITQNDVNEISKSIELLLGHQEQRRALASKAINLAEKNHNLRQVNKEFRETLCAISKIPKPS